MLQENQSINNEELDKGGSKILIGGGVLMVAVTAITAIALIAMGGSTEAVVEPEQFTCSAATLGYTMSPEDYFDASSSVTHPAVLRSNVDTPSMMVLGAGSFGDMSAALYMEPNARDEFRNFRGLSAPELRVARAPVIESSQPADGRKSRLSWSFYDSLRYSTSGRSVRLVLIRDYTTAELVAQLVPSFRTNLDQQPGLTQAAKDDLIKQFTSLLNAKSSYKQFDRLRFTAARRGTKTGKALRLLINGEEAGSIVTPELVQAAKDAFWGIFTETEFTSTETRDRFADRFPLLWLRQRLPETLQVVAETWNAVAQYDHPNLVDFTTLGEQRNSLYTGESLQSFTGQADEDDADVTVALYADDYLIGAFPENADATQMREVIRSGKTAEGAALRSLRFAVKAATLDSTPIISALSTAMYPLLTTTIPGEEADALTLFRNLFPFSMAADDVMYLTCDENDRFALVYNGKSRGILRFWQFSQELCSALFTVYLGEESVLPNADALVSALVTPPSASN
jgi:hypothetical protein